MKRNLAALATALIAGTAFAQERDLKIEDRSASTPLGRLSIDLVPRDVAHSVPHAGHALEFGFSGASGSDGQSRRAGAPPITFGGQDFAAPNDLRHEFDWRFAEAAYRYRYFFTENVGIEVLGGLGYAEFDLTVASAIGSPALPVNEKLSSTGLVGGVGFIWKILPSTSLQTRITGFGSGETEGVSAAARWDLYLVQAIGRYLALRAGVTAWSVESEREHDEFDDSLNSRIRARFSGLSLGLDLAF